MQIDTQILILSTTCLAGFSLHSQLISSSREGPLLHPKVSRNPSMLMLVLDISGSTINMNKPQIYQLGTVDQSASHEHGERDWAGP